MVAKCIHTSIKAPGLPSIPCISPSYISYQPTYKLYNTHSTSYIALVQVMCHVFKKT